MAREGCRIAVIGAGFSGVMTAIHLLWRCDPGERVYLVERGDRVGPGLAYGTHNAAPPGQRARGEHERVRRRAGPFRPLARAARARAPGRSRRAHDRRHVRAPLGVRRLRPGAAARGDQPPGRGRQSLPRHRRGDGDPPGQRRLPAGDRQRPAIPDRRRGPGAGQRGRAEGQRLRATSPIPGRRRPPHRSSPASRWSCSVPGSPWSTSAWRSPSRASRGRSTRSRAAACCRSATRPPSPGSIWRSRPSDRRSLLALFRAVRREVRRAGASAVGWRAVIDAVRPHAQTLWAELSPADKARFVRHVRPWWDIHRHRMAPPVAATLASLARLRRSARPMPAASPRSSRSAAALRVRWRAKGRAGRAAARGAAGDRLHRQHRRSLPQRRAAGPADAGRRPRPPGTLGPRRRLHHLGRPDRRPRPALARPVRGRSRDPRRLVGDHRRARDPQPRPSRWPSASWPPPAVVRAA